MSARIAAIEPEVFVRTLSLDGCEAVLCGKGREGALPEVIARAADGCRRILAG